MYSEYDTVKNFYQVRSIGLLIFCQVEPEGARRHSRYCTTIPSSGMRPLRLLWAGLTALHDAT